MSTAQRTATHTALEVLFVRKDKDNCVLHLAVVDDFVQLAARLVNALAVGTVNNKDEALRACVIVPPQRPDLVLPTDILPESKHVSASSTFCRASHNTRTHTLNLTFLYCTVSTLKPTVGIVVTGSPSLSW